ncbi:hypothetical protein Lalb_Chr23g0275551 [Lupinus albus]|uniref:Uncharacterized protein n=1 Tax=Lupinus albus TaxID=3870 RepID=A0A6A4N5N6_LUPAL|nr:hypothetical protein Lalb_Chr23g0275551 [Lupinus albus]
MIDIVVCSIHRLHHPYLIVNSMCGSVPQHCHLSVNWFGHFFQNWLGIHAICSMCLWCGHLFFNGCNIFQNSHFLSMIPFLLLLSYFFQNILLNFVLL